MDDSLSLIVEAEVTVAMVLSRPSQGILTCKVDNHPIAAIISLFLSLTIFPCCQLL